MIKRYTFFVSFVLVALFSHLTWSMEQIAIKIGKNNVKMVPKNVVSCFGVIKTCIGFCSNQGNPITKNNPIQLDKLLGSQIAAKQMLEYSNMNDLEREVFLLKLDRESRKKFINHCNTLDANLDLILLQSMKEYLKYYGATHSTFTGIYDVDTVTISPNSKCVVTGSKKIPAPTLTTIETGKQILLPFNSRFATHRTIKNIANNRQDIYCGLFSKNGKIEFLKEENPPKSFVENIDWSWDSTVELSPDGKYFAVAMKNKVVLIDRKKESQAFFEHQALIKALLFSADSNDLFFGTEGKQNNLSRIDLTTKKIKQLHGHKNNVNGLATDAESRYVVSVSDGNTKNTRLEDRLTGDYTMLGGHNKNVNAVGFIPKSTHFITVGNGTKKNMIIWNTDGEKIRIFNHPTSVKDVSCGKDVFAIACKGKKGKNNNVVNLWKFLSLPKNPSIHQAGLLCRIYCATQNNETMELDENDSDTFRSFKNENFKKAIIDMKLIANSHKLITNNTNVDSALPITS